MHKTDKHVGKIAGLFGLIVGLVWNKCGCGSGVGSIWKKYVGVGWVWARFVSVGVGAGDNIIKSVGVGWVWAQYEHVLWVWVGCGLKPVGVGRVLVQLSSPRRPLIGILSK